VIVFFILTISLCGIFFLARANLSIVDKLLYLVLRFLAAGFSLVFKVVGFYMSRDYAFLDTS